MKISSPEVGRFQVEKNLQELSHRKFHVIFLGKNSTVLSTKFARTKLFANVFFFKKKKKRIKKKKQ